MSEESCPHCGSENVVWLKSEEGNEDIHSVDYYHCNTCGRDFSVVDPYTDEDYLSE